MSNKDFCCFCGEETAYREGYMVWKAFDGKFGHERCVEHYNKKKSKKIQPEGEIENFEKQKCQMVIEKFSMEQRGEFSMENKSLEEITEEILKLYDDEVHIEEIVAITKIPRYIIESILINHHEVSFR